MSKFGATSSGDAKAEPGAAPSAIVVEEMVAVVSQGAETSLPSEVMGVAEVATVIEAQQVAAGQLELVERAKAAPLAPQGSTLESPELRSNLSLGVPSFGEKVAVEHRPKIEVIGEVCESCSA